MKTKIHDFSKKISAFLKVILSSLSLFLRPLLYKIAVIDLIFISLMLIIGKIFSIIPTSIYDKSIVSIVIVLLISSVVMFSIYLLLKLLFYKLIRKKSSILRLIVNQSTSLIIIYLLMNTIYFILRKLILAAILPEHANLLKYILLSILITISYVLLLCVQKHDHEKFTKMLIASFKEIGNKRNYLFIVYDILLLIPGYLIYTFISWIHQILLVYLKLPMESLNVSFSYCTNILVIIIIALAMGINKFIVFELNSKTDHHANHNSEIKHGSDSNNSESNQSSETKNNSANHNNHNSEDKHSEAN